MLHYNSLVILIFCLTFKGIVLRVFLMQQEQMI